jgi:NTP pyrophosphatase (non-canonical NTP hydrolase)
VRAKPDRLNFQNLQYEVDEWSQRNFGKNPPIWKFLGIVEEVGELAHALLKKLQGIRVTEDHEAKAKDAVGDLLIYTADFCARMGWDMQEIIEKTWKRVQKRDWKKDPKKGGDRGE